MEIQTLHLAPSSQQIVKTFAAFLAVRQRLHYRWHPTAPVSTDLLAQQRKRDGVARGLPVFYAARHYRHIRVQMSPEGLLWLQVEKNGHKKTRSMAGLSEQVAAGKILNVAK
ncbi:hypothetical protein [Pseudomonas sp. NFACC02]|uniref:hypothetical protein n=1 Tax=Pseudomonas sp. NFACC02 TaxID=1566250 RepID=UPI001113BAA8|nr:hypothetical protein [Pseudomonas sp. NFACC02]